MAKEIVKIPDLGGAESVEVIEISVAPGDQVSEEQALIVLESDKATMDVPSPLAGKVVRILVKEGDTVSAGSEIVEVELDGDSADEDRDSTEGKGGDRKKEADQSDSDKADSSASQSPGEENDKKDDGAATPEPEADSSSGRERASSGGGDVKTFELPDLGTEDQVEVIELSIAVGDAVEEGQALGMLESDKATMDVPAPFAGEIVELLVKEGEKVGTGTPFAKIRTGSTDTANAVKTDKETDKEGSKESDTGKASAAESQRATKADDKSEDTKSGKEQSRSASEDTAAPKPSSGPAAAQTTAHDSEGGKLYAGPAVRQLARELGVSLEMVKGSGPKGRIQKEDLTRFVKEAVNRPAVPQASGGGAIPQVPDVDFSQFGDTELVPMTKIQVLTAANMQRSWLNAPHVTHFDNADITDLEEFRQSLKAESEKRQVKITPLPFLLQAAARALRTHPQFNRSLHGDGKHFVQKDYVHIGVAVDTPRGLLVPVVRDVDKKGLWDLAEETAELATKARAGKLSVAEMQGGCFTISSLGAIGGTGFTPIINVPEVSILSVSRAEIRPVWDGQGFVPRQMLPLGLSYDHRAINGADAGRFMTYLVEVLADLRRLLL